jgi:glycosyltransferase involved in cell wall biosynthesis
MAAGVPVIATRVGGMTEIVEEGRNGLLVESGNASALAEAILQLLSDDDLRESMGKAGHQRSLEVFSWERIAENLLNQYRNIFESQEQIPLESFATPIL